MTTKELQSYLKSLQLYTDRIDGDPGPKTAAAIEAFFMKEHLPRDTFRNWPLARRLVAAEQLVFRAAGIETGEIDGLEGPQTRYAREAYETRKKEKTAGGPSSVETWRDEVPAAKATIKLPKEAKQWPTQGQVPKFFGAPGTRQARVPFPYPMRLAWDTDQFVTSTLCHELTASVVSRILNRAKDHYGVERLKELGLDLFGGCLNVRKMRGGSALSMHSFGIAWDFDPARNQLRWGRDRAQMAKRDYAPFLDFWEEEGAISLGRAKNFDWMHVQFARL